MPGVQFLPMGSSLLSHLKKVLPSLLGIFLAYWPIHDALGGPEDAPFQNGKMAFLEQRYHDAVVILSAYLDQTGRGMPVVMAARANLPTPGVISGQQPASRSSSISSYSHEINPPTTLSAEGAIVAPLGSVAMDQTSQPRPDTETRAIAMLGRALLEIGNSANSFAVLRGLDQEQSLLPVRDMLLFMQAEAAFQSGQYQVALPLYQYLTNEFPVSPWAPKSRFKIADCHYLAGDWRQARKEYTALLEQYPEYPGRTAVRLAIGDCTSKLGNPQEAAVQFRQLVMEDDDPVVTARAEQLLAGLADKKIIPRPLTAAEQLQFGKLYRRQKRWVEAEKILEELVAQLRPEAEKAMAIGMGATIGKGRPDVSKVGQVAMSLWVDAQYERGMNFFAWEKYEEALTTFQSLQRHMGEQRIGNWIARTHERMGDPDSAAAIYAGYLKGTDLVAQLADLYYWSARYDESDKYLQELFKQRPKARKDRRYRWMDAWLDYRMGRLKDAEESFADIAKTVPQMSGRAIYWQGRTVQNAGRMDEAVQLFKGLANHPTRSNSYYGILAANRLREMGTISKLSTLEEQKLQHTNGYDSGLGSSTLGQVVGEISSLLDKPYDQGNVLLASTAGPMPLLVGSANPRELYNYKPILRYEGPSTPWVPSSGPALGYGRGGSNAPVMGPFAPSPWMVNNDKGNNGALIQWGELDGRVPAVSRFADPSAYDRIADILDELADRYGDAIPGFRKTTVLVELGMLDEARVELGLVAEELRAIRRGRGESRARMIGVMGGSFMDNRKQAKALWGTELSDDAVPEAVLQFPPDTKERITSNWDHIYPRMGQAFALMGDAHYTKRYLSSDASSQLVSAEGEPVEASDYPLAFEEEIRDYTSRYGVRPALMWALMTLESAFYPKAVSRANARGLMQVIPTTGGLIARHMGVSGYSEAMLLEPELSIKFGSWYVRQLLTKFRGQEILAIAGYNAGPHNVAWWLSKKGDLPADEFVEEMAFPQARDYVRIVVSHIGSYLRLYEGHDAVYFPNVIDPAFRDNINF